jgi:uncharacterized protein YyaL (SSP411 family)
MKALRPLYWLASAAAEKQKKKDDGSTQYTIDRSDMFPSFQSVPATRPNARAGALLAADWLVNTQISTVENLSGDTGRFYGIRGLFDNTKYLSPNWLAAHGVLALLAAYWETREDKYLASARLGGEYLLGLQVLDQRLPDAFGCYREHHARFPLTGSRSCCSVIWAMVQLYKATGDKEYLESADLCGQWYINKVYTADRVAPPQDYNITANEWIHNWSGCYNGGVGVIFHQLYKATRKRIYRDRGVIDIADMFIKYFLNRDGSRAQAVMCRDGGPTEQNRNSFHRFNDDFAGISLLAAYQETKDKKYLAAALRMARWLKKETEKDGRLGGVNSAPATTLVFFDGLKRMTRTAEFDSTMAKYVSVLLYWQVRDLYHGEFLGGIRGQSHIRVNDETGQYLDSRATSYAVNGLLGWANPRGRMLLEVE